MAEAEQSNLTLLTVDLLSAYVANNDVQHADLVELIKSTHAALKVIDSPEPPAPVEPEHKAAVGLRKSLGSRAHIISMIDGKPYQTLKRHLAKHGLTPQEYRDRYSLPRDYPMVAPAYSESRRAIAERLGLGRKVTGAQTSAGAAKTAARKAPAPKAATASPAAPKAATPAKAAAAPKPAAAKAPRSAKPTAQPAAPTPTPAPAAAAEAKAPVRKAAAAKKPAAKRAAKAAKPAGAAK